MYERILTDARNEHRILYSVTLRDGSGQPCQCDVVVAYHADGRVNYLYPYVTYAGMAIADGCTRAREVIAAILERRAELHLDAVAAFIAGCANGELVAVNAIQHLMLRLHSQTRDALMQPASEALAKDINTVTGLEAAQWWVNLYLGE